ncbi:hypothetical protein D068_cds13230 [Bacillus atrophaeus UCMB-5137]|nr:hypothetical protein D068_cds13230 [Bacillus atrophaeus UCMB-5137]
MHTSNYYIAFCRKKTGKVEKKRDLIFLKKHVIPRPAYFDLIQQKNGIFQNLLSLT